jgi:hypothetical protein
MLVNEKKAKVTTSLGAAHIRVLVALSGVFRWGWCPLLHTLQRKAEYHRLPYTISVHQLVSQLQLIDAFEI